MNTNPLVSVVVPTYYREERLEHTLESVLEQTYDEIEIIVVDDSGESFARPIVDDFDVIYLPHETNKGAQVARSTGIEKAKGEYIQLLDDDDRLYPEKIEKQVELLEYSSSVGVAHCGINDRRDTDVLPEDRSDLTDLEKALQIAWPATITSSLLIESEVLKEVAPLAKRRSADDIGTKIELAKRTDFDYVDEVLVSIGNSDDNRSGDIGFVKDIGEIIEEYSELYDRHPDEVRHTALRYYNEWRCYRLLNDQVWSPTATVSMLKAQYYAKSIEPKLVGSSIASIFGRPGIQIATKLYLSL